MSNTKAKKASTKGKRATGTAARSVVGAKSNSVVVKIKTGPSSKHDQILDLLRRAQGASLKELQKASGWQSHSVRGFLSGTVKKKLKLNLSSTKSEDGERRYTVMG